MHHIILLKIPLKRLCITNIKVCRNWRFELFTLDVTDSDISIKNRLIMLLLLRFVRAEILDIADFYFFYILGGTKIGVLMDVENFAAPKKVTRVGMLLNVVCVCVSQRV